MRPKAVAACGGWKWEENQDSEKVEGNIKGSGLGKQRRVSQKHKFLS